ncbi:T7SS effector LXG polymorphic toxin [Streptococcus ruminantium]|uniref:T7SS effector LXG polymorphic toxin n=1 Tax=Streptococcus ruminantium TaxID=1917441 RepID=UPI0013EF0848|nr:T7SS effector LXG polymorphic toxin [Streptococcus ruminantium]
MAYKIHFEDITNVQREVSTTITGWAEALASIESAMSQFMSDSALQGQALNGMKSYLAEVHYPIILVLGTLMQDYSASLLLYKDGYYNIDDASKAKLPEQNLTTLKSDLEGSRNNLQNQLDLLSAEKAKINDILTYRGMSHTTTIMKYNSLINDLNRLHQSIAQYESQHTMQDLVPFKELLASTKRLLASYGSQSRNVGSYQPGSIGQLQQMQEVAAAYSNAVNHLSNRTDRIRTAQERDAVRWEAIAAEERRNQGVLNFVVGALTVVGGVVAIVATAGAATPLVVAAGATLGTGTALYGYSNMIEAEQDIIYGSLGDSKSFAVNPIRDTIFLGNNQLYHQTGQIFSIGSFIIAPIGQTGSVVKGLAQFGGGALGAWGGGELGYHGAKLLGASDSQANAAKFLSSMAGASAGSSLAGKFSLNKLTTKKMPEQASPYNKEQILKNLEESRLARESSNFGKHLEVEKAIKQRVKLHDELERRISKFDYNTASKTQKGNYGEIRAYDDLLTPKRGESHIYDLRRVGRNIPESLDAKLERGIDGIYINKSGAGSKVLIDEAKFNKSKLNPHTADGKQMNHKWIQKRIFETDFDSIEDYLTVRRAVKNKAYDSVLSIVDIDGNVKHFRLDMDANIIGTWP